MLLSKQLAVLEPLSRKQIKENVVKKVKEVGKSRTKVQVGDIFDTNNCGKLVVLEYENALNLKVKFEDTGYVTSVQADRLRKGEIKDRSLPSVFGVGIIGNEQVKIDGKYTKDYQLWNSMLRRCYDEKYSNKSPTYKDCEVSDNFKYLPYFKKWCHRQIGFDQVGWQLDKDILIKRNKVYSENTCCFVPAEINSLLIKRDSLRGDLPIGVRYYKRVRKYVAQVSRFKKVTHLGCFNTPDEAFNAYKEAKEDYVKEVANKWKDQIDPRVYEALMKYRVEITD